MWSWRPLWDYVEEVAPQLAARVEHGHTNDGDGLNARDSAKLAAILTAELDAGRTAQYEADYTAGIEALADEPCSYCGATGTRSDAVGQEAGMVERQWCNGCGGKGSRRPMTAWYEFSADNVRDFRDFLVACGGFEIW